MNDDDNDVCPECVRLRRATPNVVFEAGLCRTHYRHRQNRQKEAEWDGQPILRAREFHVWPLKYQAYEHQLEWLDLYQDNAWIEMMAPVSHGKTITDVISYACFKIAENPDVRIAIIGATAALAKLMLAAVKSHCETNVDYIGYFQKIHGFKPKPDRPKVWTKEAMTVNRISEDSAIKDPTLVAVGKGCELENRRLDIILCDDMITLKAANSDVEREADRTWFLDVVMTRGEEVSEVKVDGTPEHPDDLYEWMATGTTETGEKVSNFFKIIRVRALAPAGESHYYTDTENIVTESDLEQHELKALCPERMSLKGLLKRARLSQSTFMRKFQCRHSAAVEKMFPPAKVNACKNADLGIAGNFDAYDRGYRVTVMGIDIATGHGLSFFAMCMLGIDMEFNHVIINLFRERLRFAQSLSKILEWYRKYVPAYVGVESNGQQNMIIDAYKNVRVIDGVDVSGIERVPFEAVFTSKELIFSTTTGMSALVDRGGVVIPDRDKEAADAMEPLVREMKGWPGAQMKDCLMALLIAEHLYTQKIGVGENVGSVPNMPVVRGAYKRRVRGSRQTRYRRIHGAREEIKRDSFGLPKGGGVKVSLIDEIRRRGLR